MQAINFPQLVYKYNAKNRGFLIEVETLTFKQISKGPRIAKTILKRVQRWTLFIRASGFERTVSTKGETVNTKGETSFFDNGS